VWLTRHAALLARGLPCYRWLRVTVPGRGRYAVTLRLRVSRFWLLTRPELRLQPVPAVSWPSLSSVSVAVVAQPCGTSCLACMPGDRGREERFGSLIFSDREDRFGISRASLHALVETVEKP
jgi:hypothetical protein